VNKAITDGVSGEVHSLTWNLTLQLAPGKHGLPDTQIVKVYVNIWEKMLL